MLVRRAVVSRAHQCLNHTAHSHNLSFFSEGQKRDNGKDGKDGTNGKIRKSLKVSVCSVFSVFSVISFDHLINGRKISSLRAISALVMCLKRVGIIAREVASRAATSSWYSIA